MPTSLINLKAAALTVGLGALLACAPLAHADDPPPCPSENQDCGPALKKPKNPADQIIDGATQGGDLAGKILYHGDPGSPGWQTLLDGEPYCMHMGDHIRVGVVVTNVDPSGIAHPS